jgi:acetoin utilization deacetylase AcuC-like enzyme
MSIWMNLYKNEEVFKQLTMLDSEEATKDELILCHPSDHVDKVLKCSMDKSKNYEELIGKNKNARDFSYDTH